MNPLVNIDIEAWDAAPPEDLTQRAIAALENGRLLFFPRLTFSLKHEELPFLDPRCSDGRAKNVSYDPVTGDLKGTRLAGADRERLRALIARYCLSAQALAGSVLPAYRPHIRPGRTSYRPLEIQGRMSSYRKDDTRLHVDAFPSRPNGGERILRVFTNVNPLGQARLWRVGEPFPVCAERFLPSLPRPVPGASGLLRALGLTRGTRTPYDHYMLALHDSMKRDIRYQERCAQCEVPFPSGTTWIVFTDQVPHAAMSGQYVFEQTFRVPVAGLKDPATSPLRVLERLLGRTLAHA